MIKKSIRNRSEKEKTGLWLLSQKTNPAKIFFYLLVLFIPAQIGKHFWPDFSFIYGLRIDYLSPTLYFTDILILLVLGFWFLKKPFLFRKIFFNTKFVFLTFLVIIAGLISAQSKLAGFFGFIKFTEFLLLGFYIFKEIKKEDIGKIILFLSIGVFTESLIAFFQYINQGSLGTIFYFLGERDFNGTTPGIANASIGGKLILRPYGTFPHPNVLAGYLIIVMTMIILNLKSRMLKLKNVFLISSLLVGTVALFLTLSRIAILSWLIFFLFLLFKNLTKVNFKKLFFVIPALFFIFLILSTVPILQRFIGLTFSDVAVTQREELLFASLAMLQKNYLFGVGLNNFLVNLPAFEKQTGSTLFLQPVHNIFLIVLSETGIIGFFFFCWFLLKTFSILLKNFGNSYLNKTNSIFFVILLEVLILGLFDHYFLTLQQGQLIFTLILGLSWLEYNSGVK